MTEITENINATTSRLFWPTPAPIRYLIDPVAFIIALVAAPLLMALPGIPLLLLVWILGPQTFGSLTAIAIIPIAAVVLGGMPYLILGGPLLAHQLRRTEPERSRFFILGFLANLATPLLVMPFAILTGEYSPFSSTLFMLVFGMVFAPIWCAVFAVLYRRLRREFYQNPL